MVRMPTIERNKKSDLVAPRGFEPRSRDPESRMLGRYTTGLCSLNIHMTKVFKFYLLTAAMQNYLEGYAGGPGGI